MSKRRSDKKDRFGDSGLMVEEPELVEGPVSSMIFLPLTNLDQARIEKKGRHLLTIRGKSGGSYGNNTEGNASMIYLPFENLDSTLVEKRGRHLLVLRSQLGRNHLTLQSEAEVAVERERYDTDEDYACLVAAAPELLAAGRRTLQAIKQACAHRMEYEAKELLDQAAEDIRRALQLAGEN